MNVNRQEISRLAGFIGAAMTIAGYVRYTIEGQWGKVNPALLIAGLILLAICIVLNFDSILGFFRGRSGRMGTNTVVLSAAVIGLMIVANFLGYRHHKRFDLTAEGLHTLSDQTKKIVSNLQKDVKIIRFDKQDDPQLSDLMIEYKYLTTRLTYERIDPQQQLTLAKQYKVTKIGETVVACGDRSERPQGNAEQDITNAILKVTRDKLKTVCFTQGHGEKELSGAEGEGYSVIEKRLKDENYEIKSVSLATSGASVPSECAVLVVAGPKQSLLPPEAAMIGKYLDDGGKAMLLFDPETDPQLDAVLNTWNIQVGNNVVLEFSAVGQMFSGGPQYPLVVNYGAHPITTGFKNAMTVFPLARSIKVGSASGSGANVTSLLSTSAESFTKPEIKSSGEVKFEEGKDEKGPITLGVVGTKNNNGKESRLVVVGDSDFAINGAARFGRNQDLFLNSVNWLAQDEDLISIRPKPTTNRSVTMSESQQRTLFWALVLFLPLGVIGAGVFIWVKRR